MLVRRAREGEGSLLGRLVAAQQADPSTHVCYLGTEAGSIAEDLAALEPWGLAGVLVAEGAVGGEAGAVGGEVGGAVAGVLAVEWDTEPPRVWWHGPFVLADDWDAVADRLYAAGQAMLPAAVVEQELAPDHRNARVAAFAVRHGFTSVEASVVLTRQLDAALAGSGRAGAAPVVAGSTVEVAELQHDDHQPVAALHDLLFPGTHVPGSRLGEGRDRVVLAARLRGRVVGYVAAERQSDGGGYIDFLGVGEAFRGHGIGRLLVDTVCDHLRARYGCGVANLTVRESNDVARGLYARCGFREERLIRPWRRGFPAG